MPSALWAIDWEAIWARGIIVNIVHTHIIEFLLSWKSGPNHGSKALRVVLSHCLIDSTSRKMLALPPECRLFVFVETSVSWQCSP